MIKMHMLNIKLTSVEFPKYLKEGKNKPNLTEYAKFTLN